MRIVCLQTILMKYHALFVIFEKSSKVLKCRLLQIVGGAGPTYRLRSWHSVSVPERIFWDQKIFWKKFADDNKSMKNYPACKEFKQRLISKWLLSDLNLCTMGNFSCFMTSAFFFSKLILLKNYFRSTICIQMFCLSWSGSKSFAMIISR